MATRAVRDFNLSGHVKLIIYRNSPENDLQKLSVLRYHLIHYESIEKMCAKW